MKLHGRIEEIIGTYDGIKNPVEPGKKSGNGFYVPSPWEDLVRIFVDGMRSGLYRRSGGYFMDAGSGDGRVLALMACFGYKPFGIELDKELSEQSREVIESLVRRGIIGDNVILVNGDFTRDETYREAGVNFSSIDHIFHGINSVPLKHLSQIISRESKQGTTLTVYGPLLEEVPDLGPLQLIKKEQVGILSDVAFYMKRFNARH